MTDNELLKLYANMMDFLVAVLGENCEIVLHDVRNIEHSIIAIRNNNITGRGVNDTITDYGLLMVRNSEQYQDVNFVSNYTGKATDSGRVLCSSTYLIKNAEKKIIGMLCVNEDISPYMTARDTFKNLLSIKLKGREGAENFERLEEKQSETFTTDIKQLVGTILKESLMGYRDLKNASVEEKKSIVTMLDKKGLFMIKGAVTQIAERLAVSEQTVYRYLK